MFLHTRCVTFLYKILTILFYFIDTREQNVSKSQIGTLLAADARFYCWATIIDRPNSIETDLERHKTTLRCEGSIPPNPTHVIVMYCIEPSLWSDARTLARDVRTSKGGSSIYVLISEQLKSSRLERGGVVTNGRLSSPFLINVRICQTT